VSTILKQQLIAARESAKALAAVLDGLLSEMDRQERSEKTTCDHPVNRRISMAVMGDPGRFRCGVPGCDAIMNSSAMPAVSNDEPQEG